MKHAPPAPPELGTMDGLSYALFLPKGDPGAGVVILHGAGSAKESHFDFARGCREDGIAALAFDARGHGRSEDAFGPGALDDVHAMVELLRAYAPRVALRGSSMGGFEAIHAAAHDHSLCAVVAVCPAPERSLLRMLRSDEPLRFACDVPATEEWLESLDLIDTVRRLGPSTALLLLHAVGDEQIPYTASEALYAAAHEPKRLLILPGGHHRSIQHDPDLQAVSRRFILEAAERAASGPPMTDGSSEPAERGDP
ncbi:MAG: alpha/beta fold hydrolase [Thermoleophilaceae bacterium]|nr:alpha/beta fold hydrolase [Thermoleophilaceae bacterium]